MLALAPFFILIYRATAGKHRLIRKEEINWQCKQLTEDSGIV